jgi:hypothetical protein
VKFDSEYELQRHLHDSGVARAGDQAKRTSGRRARIIEPVGIIELGMVEGVEEFAPILERLGFADYEVLRKRQVKVVDARPVEEIPAGVPDLSEGFLGE